MNRSEDERTAIFSKPLLGSQSYGRTYGSAGRNSFSSVSVKPRKHIVKHEVKRTDTIQGLALKYGVTMEEIKRANRLYTNDSIFLRTHLEIPVASDHPSVALNGDSNHKSREELRFEDDFVEVQGAAAAAALVTSRSCDTFLRPVDEEEPCPMDFLSKYDECVEKAKVEVDQLAKSSEFAGSSDSDASPSLHEARSRGSGAMYLPGIVSRPHNERRNGPARKARVKKDNVHDQFFQL